MHDKNALLRTLPQVEELLEHPSLAPAHRLQPRQSVALGAALAGHGVIPDHAAKLRAALWMWRCR